MFFEHIFDNTLAHSSYVIGCQVSGEAIVIDPKRDVDSYLAIAQKNNLRITHITETHIHADYLSGTQELAAITGASIYLSDEGGAEWQYEFDHIGLKNGDQIRLGNLIFQVLHTPGHTPESISFLLTDTPATMEPIMVFTGDFVFVGDIGRPDLLEAAAGIQGSKDIGAQQMYRSLAKFQSLPSYVQVWPAHGAGSACGKALGAVPSSTVGYELIRNWAFQFPNDEEGFKSYLLADQPEPPRYFAMMKKLNKSVRPLLLEVPQYPSLSAEEFKAEYASHTLIIDTREKAKFAASHLAGTINIQNNKSFNTWAGWVIDYNQPFVLIAEEVELEDLARKLMRIGLDQAIGYITESDLKNLGLPLQNQRIIDYDSMLSRISDPSYQIIDVRNATEYAEAHLPGAENLFVGTLTQHLHKIDPAKKTVIHCQSGDRATLAQSLLAAHGYSEVENYSAGMKEWKEKGGPLA